MQIPVNEAGEFYKGCVCGGSDFYTVVNAGYCWREIEPVVQWEGWACANCKRVFDDNGKRLSESAPVRFLP